MDNYKMQLTAEEQTILAGRYGKTLQKVMRSVVLYGEAFHAERLVPIAGAPHLVLSVGANILQPYFDMMDELIACGLSSSRPFTVDPRPFDLETVNPGFIAGRAMRLICSQQETYEKKMREIGLKDSNAFSCACYLPEVGNIPARGAVLAWSESSAVVYANSVLGARTNRNSSGIDLLCNILDKTPFFGLLTDDGRRASWLIEVKTSRKPNAQLLGSAIGMKVVEAVPFIAGLDAFLGKRLDSPTCAYLKDMGAACASNGAVGLYHVENLTPEAREAGRSLLIPGYGRYVIDDAELDRVMASYPVLWKNRDDEPQLAFIGCPHLSRGQIQSWQEALENALREAGQERLNLPVYLCSAPDVIAAIQKDNAAVTRLENIGAKLTPVCPMMHLSNPLCRRQVVVTNSNKLRTYSTARFFLDDDLLKIVVSGKVS